MVIHNILERKKKTNSEGHSLVEATWNPPYIRVAQKQLIFLFSVPHLNLCYL